VREIVVGRLRGLHDVVVVRKPLDGCRCNGRMGWKVVDILLKDKV
jgi:hypothetical protein